MGIRPILSALAAITVLAGCGNDSTEQDVASSDQAVSQADGLTPTETQETPLSVDPAMLKKGKIVYLRCRSCHTTDADGPHLTGPNLNGLFGATAGTKAGYAFSDALKSSDIVWNAETLDAWLKQPSTYIAQNRMVFAGLPKQDDRDALIAYLAVETQ